MEKRTIVAQLYDIHSQLSKYGSTMGRVVEGRNVTKDGCRKQNSSVRHVWYDGKSLVKYEVHRTENSSSVPFKLRVRVSG